jgi:hypothetical protein
MKTSISTLLLLAITVIFILFMVGVGLLAFLIEVDAAPLCQDTLPGQPTQNCPPPIPPAEPTPTSPPPEEPTPSSPPPETLTFTPAPPTYTLTPMSDPEPSFTPTPGIYTPTVTATVTQPVLVPPDEDSPPTGKKQPTRTPTVDVTALPETGGAEDTRQAKIGIGMLFGAFLCGCIAIIANLIRRARRDSRQL